MNIDLPRYVITGRKGRQGSAIGGSTWVLSIRPFQIDVGRIDRFAVGSGLLKVTMSIDNLAKCVCIAGENYTVTCHHKP